MKKFAVIIFFIFSIYFINAGKIIPDYNFMLNLPQSIVTESKDASADLSSDKTIFTFKIGKIDGDLSILGYWKIKLGYGLGFTLSPLYKVVMAVPDMKDGLIFTQERLFSLDWITENGLNLHLFFNDDFNQTEFTFRYEFAKVLNSLYITNKFNEFEINPFRSLKGGKATDINIGFDIKKDFYYGRFDLQFNTIKPVSDTFKGNKKYIENKILSSQYARGIYYYLPDKNIIKSLEVYIGDDDGTEFTDLPAGFKEKRKYRLLSEGTDFIIDIDN